MNICEQGETFRLLLLMGVVEKSEVIAWADGIIETQDGVPDWLLDVSLAANEDFGTVESKLGDLPGEWSRLAAAYGALIRFVEAFEIEGRFNARRAARMLEVWACSAELNHEDWTAAMMPSWITSEVDSRHARDIDVIESIEGCLKHFALRQD
jgi:hypothetical protein